MPGIKSPKLTITGRPALPHEWQSPPVKMPCRDPVWEVLGLKLDLSLKLDFLGHISPHFVATTHINSAPMLFSV